MIHVPIFNALIEYLGDGSSTKIASLTGPFGVGKSTLAGKTTSGQEEYSLQLDKDLEGGLWHDPLILAMHKHPYFSVKLGEIFGNEKLLNAIREEYLYHPGTMVHKLRCLLTEGVRQGHCRFFTLDSIERYDQYLLTFFNDFLATLASPSSKLTARVILVCDDVRQCGNGRDPLLTLNRYCKNFSVPFLTEGDVLTLICEELSVDRVENKIVEKILHASSGNAFYTIAMIHYLRNHDCFFEEGDILTLKDDAAELGIGRVVEEYIRDRYEQLGSTQKSILCSASVIGQLFGVDILAKLTRTGIDLRHELANIVHQSLLIRTVKDRLSLMRFESKYAHRYVYDNTEHAERTNGHLKLAKYFETKTDHVNKFEYGLIEHIRHSCDAATHFHKAGNLKLAIKKLMHSLPSCDLVCDYKTMMDAAKKGVELLDEVAPQSLRMRFMLRYYADGCKGAGYFNEAYQAYTLLQKQPFLTTLDKDMLEYERAFCSYRSNTEMDSLTMLKPLRQKYRNEVNNIELYAKVLALLSTCYEFFGQRAKSEKLYNETMSLCRNCKPLSGLYHELLRKAGAFVAREKAIDALRESAEYFKSRDNMVKYGEVMHNLGAQMLEEEDTNKAFACFIDSHEALVGQCSKTRHYPLNSLAILSAMKGEYERAIMWFRDAYVDGDESKFSRIWISLNMATCHVLMANHEQARVQLSRAEKFIHDGYENAPYALRNYHATYASILTSEGHHGEAYAELLRALRIQLYDMENDLGYTGLLAHAAMKGAKAAGSKPDKEVVEYSNAILDRYEITLLEKNVFWGHFMFWE